MIVEDSCEAVVVAMAVRVLVEVELVRKAAAVVALMGVVAATMVASAVEVDEVAAAWLLS